MKFFYLSLFSAHAAIEDVFRLASDRAVNTNVQFLWATPLERLHFFSPDGRGKPLLPDWMREDLNLVALELYSKFVKQYNATSETDSRDAESTVRAFREFQKKHFPKGSNNSSDLVDFFGLESDSESQIKRAAASLSGLGKLLGKVATDFVHRMGFNGGTKYLYQARMWAEVLGPGDSVQPKNVAPEGAVAAGIIFTHIPEGTEGTPRLELLDPRGHNPPFGQDQRLVAQVGMGLIFPGWVDRLTPPHRHLADVGDDTEFDLLKSHRVDWVFEVGLFQYPKDALVRFFDLEMCPFGHSNEVAENQLFFQLDIEELVKIELATHALKSQNPALG